MPTFSPVPRPDLGLAVRVGRVVGAPWLEIVRAVGGVTEVELGVVGGVLVDGVDKYCTLEDDDGSHDEVEIDGMMITAGMSEDVGGRLGIREDVELANDQEVSALEGIQSKRFLLGDDENSVVEDVDTGVLLVLVLELVVLLLEVLLGSAEDDVVLEDDLAELDEEDCCSELDILVVVERRVEDTEVEFEVTGSGITVMVLMEVTDVSTAELIPVTSEESPPTVEVIS
ncbi:hypothetical protein ACEPPN_018593 [Leptodophora sp. 'Broadleaf-Isolate-01']